MKKSFLFFVISVLITPVFSQENQERTKKDYEINAGFGMIIYQSAYNFQNAFGLEAALRSGIAGPVDWQAGLRLGINPVLPEVFARILASDNAGKWRPEIGLEVGLTWRAEFEEGAMLLQETREAMQTGIHSLYMAVHTAPLAFSLKDKWKISVAEIDFGTHLTNIGRTLRAQVMVISVGRKF